MTPADPLAQLRDIHLPEPVSAWPPGPGWWVLAVALLVLLATGIAWLWRRHRRNAWRRSAQAALAAAHSEWQQSGDETRYLQTANAVLKRAALAQFSREDVAGLSAERWERFLDQQWRNAPDTNFSTLGFGLLAYQRGSEVDIEQVHHLSRRWVAQLRGSSC